MNVMKGIQRNLPVILTAIGTIGVVATAVLTARATPKAMDILEEHEDDDLRTKVINLAPVYAIPAATGVATIACVISAQVINQKRIGSLAASYAALGGLYTRYRDKVKDKIGEVEESLINKAAREETITDICNGKQWYKDPITGTTWETTAEDFLQAQLDINEEFAMTGSACLADFLYMAKAPKNAVHSRTAQLSKWNVEDTAANDIYYIRMNTIDTDDMRQGRRVKRIIYEIDPLLYGNADKEEVYATLGYSPQ